MSVIDSLSAGYRFLGRHLELLIAPILLDLLFWLGPRFSVAPLMEQIGAFYSQASTIEGMPSDLVDMSQQMATLMADSGGNSNLLGVLANSSLLHVPSLLAGNAPTTQRLVIEVASPVTAVMLLIGFSLLGVLIGVVYMNMLARTLPIGDGPKPESFSAFIKVVLRQSGMVILYVVLILGVLIVGAIPITLAVALLSMINPVIGSLVLMVLTGMLLVFFFYLYFVTAALILDNLPVHRAITQSFVLVRNNFWATLAFVMLYNVITLGFAFIMANLAEITPAGTLAAILIYAYIGSGLAMALLVFYRTRILKADEGLAAAA